MGSLTEVFEDVLDHRANGKHYAAGELMLNTAKKYKLDLDDLLDLLVQYVGTK
jgi:hypothetical protein